MLLVCVGVWCKMLNLFLKHTAKFVASRQFVEDKSDHIPPSKRHRTTFHETIKTQNRLHRLVFSFCTFLFMPSIKSTSPRQSYSGFRHFLQSIIHLRQHIKNFSENLFTLYSILKGSPVQQNDRLPFKAVITLRFHRHLMIQNIAFYPVMQIQSVKMLAFSPFEQTLEHPNFFSFIPACRILSKTHSSQKCLAVNHNFIENSLHRYTAKSLTFNSHTNLQY